MISHPRIWLVLALIIFSAIYAFLVADGIGKAVAWALGYISIVLTVMLLINLWKDHDDNS